MVDIAIPQVNFYSMLSGLGDTLQANRVAQAKKDAFAAATTPGPDGKIDYGKAILGLAQVDPQAASIIAQRQNHEDTLHQQAIENARAVANDAFNHTYQNATLALQNRVQDRLDDPTPTGFTRQGNTLVPLTGGPADPAYIASVAAAKAKEGGGGLSLNPIYGKDKDGNTVLLQAGKNGVAVQSKLPDGVTLNGVDNETLAADAARLNAGDPNVLKKYSNKGQGRVDLLRLNNEANRQRQAAGLDPIDITQNAVAMQGDMARERAAGTMEGRMAPAAIEAQGAFKLAKAASDNLFRTNFVPFNKVLQAGQAAFSDPTLKAASTAYNTAVMTYSKAVAPTGVGTVAAQEHARQILAEADGPAATKAAFDQLDKEVDMAHQAPGLARQYFADARKARLAGQPPPPMPVYQPNQPGDGSPRVPPPAAIEALKKDWRRAGEFDEYYGPGAAAKALGVRQ